MTGIAPNELMATPLLIFRHLVAQLTRSTNTAGVAEMQRMAEATRGEQ